MVETSQKEPEQYQELHRTITTSPLQDEDSKMKKMKVDTQCEEQEERENKDTTANIPIVRGNTPRIVAYTVPALLQEHDEEPNDGQFDNVAIPPFPSKPPSAPPVPEAETRFDVIEKSRLPQSLASLQEEQVGQATSPDVYAVHTKRMNLRTRKLQQPPAQTTPILVDQTIPSQHTLVPRSTRLMGFAIYLLWMLLMVLVFAIVQGVGVINDVLSPSVELLGVPWMVLIYGLLAGCVSCLVTLGRYQHIYPPVFVLITWYARPFVAVILALFAYLMLNSGLLLAEGGMARHQGLALVVGAIAGLCEGWLFLRRNERRMSDE